MEGLLPVLGIWALLCAVLVGYVIYRFVTDRPNDSQRHPLYPLVSRPTDPTFPAPGAWMRWAAYICLLAVPCGVLGALATDMNLIAAPWSGMIAGLGLLLGLSFIALAKLTGKNK
jgi:hypothetical protein